MLVVAALRVVLAGIARLGQLLIEGLVGGFVLAKDIANVNRFYLGAGEGT